MDQKQLEAAQEAIAAVKQEVIRLAESGNTSLHGEVAPEQLAKWQAKYGAVHILYIPEDEEATSFVVGYLRPMDRNTLAIAMQFGTNKVKEAEQILTECWLGGDERIKTVDQFFFAAMIEVQNLMQFRIGALKKSSKVQPSAPMKQPTRSGRRTR